MRAAVLHAVGAVPRCEEFPEPTVIDGEALIQVRAAALNPSARAVAAGSHFTRPTQLPAVAGLDGVGTLEDGSRVFFAGPRAPYGTMAQRAAVKPHRCWPVPDDVDDLLAAAIPNPAMSCWLPLVWSAKLAEGETVLVLGATGTAGKLAVQIAKLLGAGRVVAAGRNKKVLAGLHDLGADATVSLTGPADQISEAFAAEAGDSGYDVILDYLWGAPTEALLSTMGKTEFHLAASGPRLVQIGEGAGATISLSASTVRSAGLTIVGGGFPPPEIFVDAFKRIMAHAANGELRVDTEAVPLAEIEEAWQRGDRDGRRQVVVP